LEIILSTFSISSLSTTQVIFSLSSFTSSSELNKFFILWIKPQVLVLISSSIIFLFTSVTSSSITSSSFSNFNSIFSISEIFFSKSILSISKLLQV